MFGGRFAFHYFTAEYGLTAYSAYDSCSEETEPSAKAVSEVIGRVREDRLPVVYYEELTEPKVAPLDCTGDGSEAPAAAIPP